MNKLNAKRVKRILIALALIVTFLFMFSAIALGGGWHEIGNEHNPDAGKWNKATSPHLGLQTSGNNCKTCHGVHDADDGSSGKSFKILRDKTRVTECNFCHDATSGVSEKRPYQVGEYKRVRGEHSLGSTVIPDANLATIFNGINKDGLSCGSCHSVHGAAIMNGANIDPQWENKILKKDPAGNGGDAGISTAYNGGDIAGGFTVTSSNSNSSNGYAASKTAFCSDCHNDNSNWDENPNDELAGNNPNYSRPNSKSHVQGPASDGFIMVDGKKAQIAGFGSYENKETKAAGRTGWKLKQTTDRGCFSCHQAGSGGATFPYDGTSSSFPHQSISSKFLIDNYTQAEDGWVNERDAKNVRQSNRGINQAARPLNVMDKVCLDCHRNRRGESDTLGVGKHF